MVRPGLQVWTWTWTLCVLLRWMCVDQVFAGPQYMVAIPAVLEAGATAKLCADLMQPNEALTMTTSLVYKKRTTLFKWASRKDLHTCAQFQVPLVQNDEVWNFEVEVQGSMFSSKEVRKVMLRVYQPMTFVQTDKPIYLPGQTVLFRVVALDTQLRPASQLYNIIEMADPNNNRLGQWLNETSSGKILQLSYSLSSEAREGTYQIIVSAGENKMIQSFKVERYVLPKFEVTINTAEEASVVQEEVKAEVCAKYTYGQPVPGSVKVQMCRPLQEYIFGLNGVPDVPPPCYEETKQADKRGCASFTFKMSRFTKIDQKVLQDLLVLRASVEEEGTGISLSQEKNITISYVVGKLSFIDTPKLYKQGSTVKGKVKVVSYSGAPVPRIPLYLFEGEVWSSRLLQNLTTDTYGIAAFSVGTADHSGNIHLQVSTTPTLEYPGYRVPYYEAQDQILSMVQPFSPDTATVSFLEVMKDDPLPCDKEQDIFIRFTIVGEDRGSVDLMYLVLSRGTITMQGFKRLNIQDTSVTEGEVSFKLKVAPEMAPAVHIVAYAILPSETVIASSADFPTEKCFSNKVSLKFTPSSAVPQEDVTMRVMAVPGSLCGVSIVDKSVFVKEPGTGLDADKIFNLLPVTSGSYIPYEVQDPTECLTVRAKRSILPPYPGGGDSVDPYTVFQNVRLKMATNLFVQMPSCVKFKGREYYQGRFGFGLPLESKVAHDLAPGVAAPVPSNTLAQSVVTIRTFFPETWLWDLVEVRESGTKDVSLTAPDTITTWETEAFCLSPQGFGLAPRTEITVFQPFFLELTLPYSIIRGERFRLKATVFNYLTSCIMVTVTPAPSLDYTVTPFSGDQYRACLCGSERKTFSWTMTPSVLGTVNVTVTAEASRGSCGNNIVSVPDRGRIDVVTKALIVKAEGTEVTETYNWLLCPKGQALTDKMDVRLPDNVVAGSASASVSVLGDILGRALQNLDGLLQMPSGCGEQNMVLLAPDIYILQYLSNTGQLTPAIKEKATNFLISGYQRELNYKLDDGSFSTFGVPPGNTWLTAFVLRSFVKAQSFIYIDPNVIDQSKTWLVNQQQENGCFLQSGKIYDNGIQGGVSSSVALSAYITAAFLEMKVSVNDPVIRKGLSCLKESISDLSNTYTTALLAYVFTLARDVRTRTLLLQHLDTVAIKQGGSLHWSQTSAETSASLSVEISAYVLLAKLSSSPTAEDLGCASLIVRWLTSQQNYYGGFSSTQDTVVALQALALYATLVFSSTGSSTVTVQSSRGLLVFDVNQKNKLLYQEKMLQGVTGSYSLEVKGTACVSVQIALHYNIPTPTKAATLGVRVRPVADCNDKSPRLTLNIIVLYSGKETSTNMVILDIKMLSGFIPDPESMNKLKGALLVDRVEQKEDHIVVYIQELPKVIPVNLQLVLVQELPVQNLKPAVVEIYDYYQPSDQAKTEYIYPCAAA